MAMVSGLSKSGEQEKFVEFMSPNSASKFMLKSVPEYVHPPPTPVQ